jgi:hypothetical protein
MSNFENSSGETVINSGGSSSSSAIGVIVGATTLVCSFAALAAAYYLYTLIQDEKSQLAVSGNITCDTIQAGSGSLGPALLMNWSSTNMTTVGQRIPISNEPFATANTYNGVLLNGAGSAGTYPIFQSGFGSLVNAAQTNETITLNKARLWIRGVGLALSTNTTTLSVDIANQDSTDNGVWNSLTQFSFSDSGFDRGYETIVSPWFTLNNTDVPCLALRLVATTTTGFMCGTIHIQFSS